MSTNGVLYIHAQEEDTDILCGLLSHYDGYPEGYGKEIEDFLNSITLVNGLNSKQQNKRVANGMDCLAAQLVVHFKKRPGDFYLGSESYLQHDYPFEYHVFCQDSTLYIKAFDRKQNVLYCRQVGK